MTHNPLNLVQKLVRSYNFRKKINWGIRSRVLMLVLLPAAAIAVALSFFFITVQIDDLENSLKERSKSIINQLASVSSHYSLRKGNFKLREISRTMLSELDVLRISIKNAKGEYLVQESNPIDKKIKQSRKFIYKAPIIKTFHSRTNSQARTVGWVIGEFTHKNTTARKQMVILEGFFITLIGLIISTYLALRMGKNVTEPIIRLTETVHDMAEGKLDTRVNEKSKGEIGTLEQGINSMGSVIQETQEYLQQKIQTATLQLRNTLSDMELQNEELDKARKQALEMSLIKSEFLSNMSHEIRTPLNGVLGFTNLLLKTQLNTIQKEQVNTIKQSTTALLTVINDTLDFSRIEAGNFKIEKIPFNLREILEDAVTLLTPNAYDKGLDLVLMLYSDVPKRVLSDAVRIRQLITNLVSNAIKFTSQGSITLRVALEEETANDVLIKVSVQDTGVGIRTKEQKKLFEPYVKLEDPGTGTYSSVRLGLVVCKKLVENMNGRIGVESKIKQGSTFWFTFKAAIDKSKIEAQNKANPLQKYRCLLYDKHETSRLAIVHQISDWGMDLEEAEVIDNIPNLISQKASKAEPYNLILFSLDKAELETNAFKKVMSRLKLNKVPIIVLATSVNKNLFNDLLQQGAGLVVPKSIRVQQLFDKLCHALAHDNQTNRQTFRSQLEKNRISAFDFSGINVLVVDDNKINRKLIQALLQERGANILEAKNGKIAVDTFAAQHIDLILMDIQMPSMNGLEATKKIRAMEHGQQRTPIVALTANIMDGDQERFVRAGFDDFLIKPIQETNLLDLITKWVNIDTVDQILNLVEDKSKEISVKTTEPEIISKMFDRKQALRLTGGNMELAIELFHMLVSDLPNMKSKVNQALSPLDYTKLESIAHKIHGAASYCAVNSINASANLVEKAAHKKSDVDIFKYAKLLNKDIDALLLEQNEKLNSDI